MTSQIKWTVSIVFVVSLLLNVFFIQNFFTRKPTIVYRDNVIEKPITVIQVKTEYVIKEKFITRPQVIVPAGRSTESVLLTLLEMTNPIITTEPFVIVQNKNKQFVFPKSVAGSMELGYIKYKFDLHPKAKIIYTAPMYIPIELGLLYFYQNKNMVFTPEVMFPFIIPFTDTKIYVGAGLDMVSLSSGLQLLDNSFLQVGLGYKYNRDVVPFLGMSLGF